MPDDRLLKQVMFGIVEVSYRRERPRRRWSGDKTLKNRATMIIIHSARRGQSERNCDRITSSLWSLMMIMMMMIMMMITLSQKLLLVVARHLQFA